MLCMIAFAGWDGSLIHVRLCVAGWDGSLIHVRLCVAGWDGSLIHVRLCVAGWDGITHFDTGELLHTHACDVRDLGGCTLPAYMLYGLNI